MDYSLLEVAFSGLMHDIGKFYQRTFIKSDLTQHEKDVTPIAKAGYHTHLHSAYTSRFFREHLKMFDEFERLTSSHHLNENNQFLNLLKKADVIASKIDRNDEDSDYEEYKKRNAFQITRMSSIMQEIDFGKAKQKGIFSLNPFSENNYPNSHYQEKDKKESVNEYKELWEQMIADFYSENQFFSKQINKYCFDRMYALLYEYTTFVPASTYEGNTTFVSLFDHLKLTSAIASCLYFNEDNKQNPFLMFEFDISGIQNFIFKVTEGKDTKKDIAKALRGRSFLISAITNVITYSYLNEFNLTQSNIIFNTGGGALLLLPNTKEASIKIENISKIISEALLKLFGTDISYVYAFTECDEKELETFKTDKATFLKSKLEEEKTRKFHQVINDDFFFHKQKHNHICQMCGTNLVEEKNEICPICQVIKDLSNFFVKHKEMYLLYDFHHTFENRLNNAICIDLGYMQLYLMDDSEYNTIVQNSYDYIESINHSHLGNTRWIANLVPQKENRLKNFEQITEQLIDSSYGDPKLGILKMDVDNLGAIFTFGLDDSRSLSKFLTLSRLIEVFFGHHLIQICKDVSKDLNSIIDQTCDNGTMFYINYAGGDDLVIIGPIAGILELANMIHKCFKDYTLNENMSISAGITVQSPTAPIRFGIKEAEEHLNQSKQNKNKNSITLLNTTCKMDKFDEILKQCKEFKSYIDDGKISRTNFYHIMHILDTDNESAYLQSIPKLMYSLKRNVLDQTTREKLIEKITCNNIHSLKILVLEMKLAIMQTRR